MIKKQKKEKKKKNKKKTPNQTKRPLEGFLFEWLDIWMCSMHERKDEREKKTGINTKINENKRNDAKFVQSDNSINRFIRDT